MKIHIASDHAGFELKNTIRDYLKEKGYDVTDHGANQYDALDNSDGLILITEWPEFRSPDFAMIKNKLKTPIIFDGRNQYIVEELEQIGFEYYQIGKNNK